MQASVPADGNASKGSNTSPSKCAMITTARETTEKEIKI